MIFWQKFENYLLHHPTWPKMRWNTKNVKGIVADPRCGICSKATLFGSRILSQGHSTKIVRRDVLFEEFMDTILSALIDPSCRLVVNYLRTALIGFRCMSLIPVNWKLWFKLDGHFSLLCCGWVKYVKMIFSHFVKAMHVHWRNNICHWIICVRFYPNLQGV